MNHIGGLSLNSYFSVRLSESKENVHTLYKRHEKALCDVLSVDPYTTTTDVFFSKVDSLSTVFEVKSEILQIADSVHNARFNTSIYNPLGNPF